MSDTPDTAALLPWAVKRDWGFKAVQIIKVSRSRAYYIDQWAGRKQERFCDSSKILPWRGDEAGAQKLVEQLKSASAECTRRQIAAQQWLDARVHELAALSQAGCASE